MESRKAAANHRAPRTAQACNYCREKKYRCSGQYPCRHCQRRPQIHHPASEKKAAKNYVKSLEERLGLRQGQETRDSRGQTQLAVLPSAVVSATQSGAAAEAAVGDGSDQPLEDLDPEVTEVNRHTLALEYHGSTSSFAFLSRARQEYLSQKEGYSEGPREDTVSLVSTLHNTAFSPPGSDHVPKQQLDPLFTSPRTMVFLDSYFSTLHYVHPFVDKEYVYATCECIWKGQYENARPSFVNLYLAIISLGALLSLGEEPVAGIGRHDWSRMAFRQVANAFAPGVAGRAADVDTIQTLFLLAKVCQNELDLNLAWFFLGYAIRTSISIGLNRVTASITGPSTPEQLSRTWWGMYSMELELCSSLGRGDSLADDRYHNRPLPAISDDSPYSIITIMVRLTRIFRSVSLDIYLSNASLQSKLDMATKLRGSLDQWQGSLPKSLRPGHANGSLRQATWVSIQQLILHIRYLNVLTVLMRPFLVHTCKNSSTSSNQLIEAAHLGADSAVATIRVIYEALQSRPYFRRMWYSCTYIIFAASVMIMLLASPNPPISKPIISQQIEKCLEVLESLEECIVAIKAAEAIRSLLRPSRPPTSQREHLAMQEEAPNYPDSMYDFMEQFTAPFEMMEPGTWQFDLDGLGFDLRDFR